MPRNGLGGADKRFPWQTVRLADSLHSPRPVPLLPSLYLPPFPLPFLPPSLSHFLGWTVDYLRPFDRLVSSLELASTAGLGTAAPPPGCLLQAGQPIKDFPFGVMLNRRCSWGCQHWGGGGDGRDRQIEEIFRGKIYLVEGWREHKLWNQMDLSLSLTSIFFKLFLALLSNIRQIL